ncbi:type ISP restriction/modification enzyme [Neorhizobium petrolearium]|uniref:Type ISP restriction-modification enzyme LLaBIII C-terminal specificity domain-containing protein n=1 Tax=Neorhizobium petrolearium TaxID=515361 RepID=A0ABY8M971_9HYPH|nr:type ISP restriction/modification enzyme [Neorhizobium petrolearium]MCC2609082.1 hypothetical protein [Neorhizobium petrolearium]WGI71083.1 hypothetical protein QEO92_04315 [Neorhizobium petrolearium]
MDTYESERARWEAQSESKTTGGWVDRSIKWTSELENYLRTSVPLKFRRERIRPAAYRPFCSLHTYYDRIVTHRLYQQDSIFPFERVEANQLIVFSDPAAQKPWMTCSVDRLPDLHYVGAAAGTVCTPLYRYTSSGERVDNITDWGLKQFQSHYGKAEKISKEDIFHYVYGVLHDPLYREKYALNLKREFPRIPFYPDFRAWADWGKRLMELHIGYETVEPWPLERLDTPDEKARAAGVSAKAILKADKEGGIIRLDSETQLSGIPAEAWTYRLGNRSGLEWILDQYKEKTPKDPTIREKFNTYRFADYKEKVIDLLMRVTRVSVETVAITEAMKSARRATEDAA